MLPPTSTISHLTRVEWKPVGIEGDPLRCHEYIALGPGLPTWRCVNEEGHGGWCRHESDGNWARILWDPKRVGI